MTEIIVNEYIVARDVQPDWISNITPVVLSDIFWDCISETYLIRHWYRVKQTGPKSYVWANTTIYMYMITMYPRQLGRTSTNFEEPDTLGGSKGLKFQRWPRSLMVIQQYNIKNWTDTRIAQWKKTAIANWIITMQKNLGEIFCIWLWISQLFHQNKHI